MVVTTVMVRVKREHIEDFKEACGRNHEASRREAGNVRFDILQSHDDPTVFMLYEAYDSAETAGLHKQTAHYAAWRDEVAEWMAEPRRGIGYRLLFPADPHATR